MRVSDVRKAGRRSRLDPAYIARLGRNLDSQATRSIELLDAIDCTLDALRADVEMLGSLVTVFRHIAEVLTDVSMDPPVVDPEDIGARGLRAGLTATENMHAALVAKRESAACDERLCEDDGVVAAFDEALAVCRDLYEVTLEVEELFLEALADHEVPGNAVYHSAEDLIAALRG